MMFPAATLFLVALTARTVTLEEAEHAAAADRPDIHLADANVAAGIARNDEARAPLLPQVKIEGLYERTTGNRQQKPGHTNNYGNTFDTFNWFDNQISASQMIWDFGQTPNRWRAARTRAVALGDSARSTRLEALADVRTAYFRASAQKSLVGVARQTLGNRQRHLEQIRGFVHAGTRPDIDLAQAVADEANARVQVIRAENGYAVARAQLNQAMGTTGDTDFDVADETFPPQPGEGSPLGSLIDDAIRARPDLAATEAQIRAQELTLRATRDGYWPTLNLVAGAESAGQSFSKSHTLDNFGQVVPYGGMAWNLFGGVNLIWPIFQGLLTRSQAREADAVLDGLRAQHDALVQQVWVAVEQAALVVGAAREALVASGEALAGARARLRMADGRYSAGVGSIIELSDAELAAELAGAQEVGAQYDLATARAALCLALGRS
ncbi:MAG TPA: TolC family protein [Polyangia bacterium]|jgi:outer membrane protein|nr:TolC family protein [Polyangia bacterium]